MACCQNPVPANTPFELFFVFVYFSISPFTFLRKTSLGGFCAQARPKQHDIKPNKSKWKNQKSIPIRRSHERCWVNADPSGWNECCENNIITVLIGSDHICVHIFVVSVVFLMLLITCSLRFSLFIMFVFFICQHDQYLWCYLQQEMHMPPNINNK